MYRDQSPAQKRAVRTDGFPGQFDGNVRRFAWEVLKTYSDLAKGPTCLLLTVGSSRTLAEADCRLGHAERLTRVGSKVIG